MIAITVVIVDERGRSKPTPLRDPTLAATAPFKLILLPGKFLKIARCNCKRAPAEGIFAATAGEA